jgi:hypothetical protein
MLHFEDGIMMHRLGGLLFAKFWKISQCGAIEMR